LCGRLTPGLSALSVAASQYSMLPSRIPEIARSDNLRSATPGTLYPKTIAPIAIGNWLNLPALSSFGLSGLSEPPKSTWRAVTPFIPAPEPVGE